MNKRSLEVVVLSDLHLGTYGCHALELLQYLKSIQSKVLVLNGDIIDIWQFKKSYFPKAHLAVVAQLIKMASKGCHVYYLTGNHDEMLRRFTPVQMGNFRMDDKLVLELDGKKAWFFHGDVFDNSISGAKWLAKLGGVGYDILVLFINKLLKKLGRPKVSLSKKVKDSVKRAVKHVHDFEQLAAELALQKGYDYVVMGHIHKAQIRTIETKEASIEYLNSGDWIENLTALEYKEKTWSIFQYQEKDFAHTVEDMPSEADELEHSAGALLASFMEGIEVK